MLSFGLKKNSCPLTCLIRYTKQQFYLFENNRHCISHATKVRGEKNRWDERPSEQMIYCMKPLGVSIS